ncbi:MULTISPECIES: hypothetical protein [unclassified Acinetobacter]|uniref:hypothetical protein n=1 Tax=unclassified Acinetobacter TaxID=196816 RepID=UPI0035B77B1A
MTNQNNDLLVSKLPKVDVPKIKINAEFQRLIWLNFNFALLAVVFCCYAFFIYNASFNSLKNSIVPEQVAHSAWVGYFIFGISAVILLQRSFMQDIKSQFWDQIRMSALSAWQVTWTRLFIAPILAWCGIVVSVFLVDWGFDTYSDAAPTILSRIMMFIALIAVAVLGMSAVMINELQFNRSTKEWNGSYLQLFLLVVFSSLYVGELISSILTGEWEALFFNVDFFETPSYLTNFSVLIAIIALYSAYRSMRYKLHLKSNQHYWLVLSLILPFLLSIINIIFLLVNTQYMRISSGADAITYSKSAYILYNIMLYMMVIYFSACALSILGQDNRLVQFKLAKSALQQKQYRQALAYLPLWVVVLPVGSILIAICYYLFLGTQSVIPNNGLNEYTFHLWSWFGRVGILLIMVAIYHLGSRIFPKMNSVTVVLIAMLILYFMWKLVN